MMQQLRSIKVCLSPLCATVRLFLSNNKTMGTRQLIRSFESGKVLKGQQKNVLIVYAHQEPKSFNSALLRTAVEALKSNGHSVEVSDLYSMHFEPRTQRSDIIGSTNNADFFKYQVDTKAAYENDTLSGDIKAEIEKLNRADLVIFQFPLFWFNFPAIMKGWFDRVFVMGYAFGGGKFFQEAGMKGKKAMLSFTTGGTASSYSTTGMAGDINVILWSMQCGCLSFVGFDVLAPQISYSPAHVSDEERKEILSDWSKRMNTIFEEEPLKFVHISNFTPLEMTEDYIKTQEGKEYGPAVGYHMGKKFPPNSMVKP